MAISVSSLLNQPLNTSTEILIVVVALVFAVGIIYLYKRLKRAKKMQQPKPAAPRPELPPQENPPYQPSSMVKMSVYDNDTNKMEDFSTYDSLEDAVTYLVDNNMLDGKYAKIESEDFLNEIKTEKQAEQLLKVLRSRKRGAAK